LTLDGVKSWERRPLSVLAHVETLATALDLDMRAYWKPTAVRYLDRVTKAHIVAAVSDGVSGEAAGRLAGLKKPDMVAAAEPLLVEAGWLPAVLRTVKPVEAEAAVPEPDPAQGGADAGEAHAEAGVVGVEDEAETPAAPDLANPLTDDAEPLETLDGVGQLEQSEAEAAEVEGLLPVAG
jgi:ParB family chromosome partitioning protein